LKRRSGRQRGAVAAMDADTAQWFLLPPSSTPSSLLPPPLQIHCHDGGMMKLGDTWFWYGTSRKEAPSWLSSSVTLYSSADLQNWKFRGHILNGSQIKHPGFEEPWRIERPKIVYNKRNDNYVILFHLDAPNFALSSIGVAVAPKIDGPYTWVRGFKPDGKDVYDMTAFVDRDGKGYVVASVENRYQGVFRLTDDFQSTVGPACGTTPRAEAPAVFFGPRKGEYHLIASHLTGWASNQALQMSYQETGGEGPCGTWSVGPPPVFGQGQELTYDSQSTFVFPIDNPNGGPPLWVYQGDRWNHDGPLPGAVSNATYVWFPILPLTGTADPTQYAMPNVNHWSPKTFINKTLTIPVGELPRARRYSLVPPRGMEDAVSGGAVPARWTDTAVAAAVDKSERDTARAEDLATVDVVATAPEAAAIQADEVEFAGSAAAPGGTVSASSLETAADEAAP